MIQSDEEGPDKKKRKILMNYVFHYNKKYNTK